MKIKDMLKEISLFKEVEVGSYAIDTDGGCSDHGVCSIIRRGKSGCYAYKKLFEYSFNYRVL